jgi:hypothetical protein
MTSESNLSVDYEALRGAAAQISAIAESVASAGAVATGAMGTAIGAVGESGLAGELSELQSAWNVTLGLLSNATENTDSSALTAVQIYTATDGSLSTTAEQL